MQIADTNALTKGLRSVSTKEFLADLQKKRQGIVTTRREYLEHVMNQRAMAEDAGDNLRRARELDTSHMQQSASEFTRLCQHNLEEIKTDLATAESELRKVEKELADIDDQIRKVCDLN